MPWNMRSESSCGYEDCSNSNHFECGISAHLLSLHDITTSSFHTPLTQPRFSSFPSAGKIRIRQTKLRSSIWKREVKPNGMFLLRHFPQQTFVRVYSRQGTGEWKKWMEFLPAIQWGEKPPSSHCREKPASRLSGNVRDGAAQWTSNGSRTC